MSVVTSLQAVSFSLAAMQNSEVVAVDLLANLALAQGKTSELVLCLRALAAVLPPSDPAIQTIKSTIDTLQVLGWLNFADPNQSANVRILWIGV